MRHAGPTFYPSRPLLGGRQVASGERRGQCVRVLELTHTIAITAAIRRSFMYALRAGAVNVPSVQVGHSVPQARPELRARRGQVGLVFVWLA
jgi:hypothetical protein